MSLPLVDFRGKITHETDAVLDALHHATGRDRSEIARDALHLWAELKIHEASLIDVQIAPRGPARDCRWHRREREGFAGSGRE